MREFAHAPQDLWSPAQLQRPTGSCDDDAGEDMSGANADRHRCGLRSTQHPVPCVHVAASGNGGIGHQQKQSVTQRAMPMQERTCLGRLLNATIVVCGACYILYVAVYLGLDLQTFIAKPSHDPVRLRLHLRSNPSDWVSSLPDNRPDLRSQDA